MTLGWVFCLVPFGKEIIHGASWRKVWCVMTHCVKYAVLGSFGTHDLVSPKGAFMMSYPIYRIFLSPQTNPFFLNHYLKLKRGYWISIKKGRKERKTEKRVSVVENWSESSKYTDTPSRQVYPCPISYDSRWTCVEERHLTLYSTIEPANRRTGTSVTFSVVWDARKVTNVTGEGKKVQSTLRVPSIWHW